MPKWILPIKPRVVVSNYNDQAAYVTVRHVCYSVLYCVSQSLDPTDTIPDELIETEMSAEILKQTCPTNLANVKDEEVSL